MFQRRTASSRLPEGGGFRSVRLLLESEIINSTFARARKWVPGALATITMCLVGTVYGWTNISFLRRTYGYGEEPLTLTRDEYSWSVSLTVLSSMIGALVAAKLADRIGRKYCLILCSTVFTFGWFEMYRATSVQNLYFARGVLGIGVGIARTINPMFVSEVTDIEYRGLVSVLISTDVYIGSLLTYALEHSLTYTSHLLALIVISGISILPLMCLRETPYFLVAKGQKAQARKSIAYYKGIKDPERVKIELGALRAEARYGLHQQSRSDLSSQSGSDLHPPYGSNEPPPYSIDAPPPRSIDESPPCSIEEPPLCRITLPLSLSNELPPPRSIDEPPPRSIDELPPYSIEEPPLCRITLPLSLSNDLPPPRSIDEPPPCSIEEPPLCRITLPLSLSDDLPPPYRRNLPSQSIREAHSDPAREVVGTEATSDLHLPSSSDSPSESISSVQSEFKCEVNKQPTGELRVEYSRDSSALPLPISRELHSQSTSEVHPPSTSGAHRPSASEVHTPSTSGAHRPSASEVHTPSASEVHPPSTSQIHRPSRREINPDHMCEIQSRSRSDLRTQPNVVSRTLTAILVPLMDGTKYTCLNKLRAILQGSNRRALFIMLGLIMAQQLSGNFIAALHLQKLIIKETAASDIYIMMIMFEIIRHCSGYIPAALANLYGRKKLLLLSMLGSSVTLMTLTIHLLLTKRKTGYDNIIILFALQLILYKALFQIGLGTLPNTFLCDLFPTKLKGFVGAIVVIFDGAIGLIGPLLRQAFPDILVFETIYLLSGISLSIASYLVLKFVPETKGKTYREIEALLVGENLNSLNEEVRTDEMDTTRI